MTGQEHYEEAERLIFEAGWDTPVVVATAQVHATLALVAAFAGTLSGLDEKLAQLKFPWLIG